MRQYEPIWYKLKTLPLTEASKKGVSVTANRALHARIIKAVTKEKWKDIAFKSSISPLKVILTYKRSNAILTFYIHVVDESIKLLDHRHL
jgi:hypothetical protein